MVQIWYNVYSPITIFSLLSSWSDHDQAVSPCKSDAKQPKDKLEQVFQ